MLTLGFCNAVQFADTLSSSSCLSLRCSHTLNATISRAHFLNLCHVLTSSHTDILAPDAISACGESLFEDKGFPRLRRAAGSIETRRRLAAECEERVRLVGGDV